MVLGAFCLNGRIHADGFIDCSGGLDMLLDGKGAFKTSSDPEVCIYNRLIIWMQPKRERTKATVGSSLIDFMHKRMTVSNIKKLEGDILYELKNFVLPEYNVISVKIKRIDRNALFILIITMYGAYPFGFSASDAANLQLDLKQALSDLIEFQDINTMEEGY